MTNKHPTPALSDKPDNHQPELSDAEKGALSLLYDGRNAPNIAIKGYHHLADKIVQNAKDNKLLVHQDPELFKRLEHLEPGQHIPPNLYVVIAELIAFSYVLRGKFPDSWE